MYDFSRCPMCTYYIYNMRYVHVSEAREDILHSQHVSVHRIECVSNSYSDCGGPHINPLAKDIIQYVRIQGRTMEYSERTLHILLLLLYCSRPRDRRGRRRRRRHNSAHDKQVEKKNIIHNRAHKRHVLRGLRYRFFFFSPFPPPHVFILD